MFTVLSFFVRYETEIIPPETNSAEVNPKTRPSNWGTVDGKAIK